MNLPNYRSFIWKNNGGALLITLIFLAGIAVLVSTLLILGQNTSESVKALDRYNRLSEAAYSAMIEAEKTLYQHPEKHIEDAQRCRPGICTIKSINWENARKTLKSNAKIKQFAIYFNDYLPFDLSLFSRHGIYVFSNYARASINKRHRGIILAENFWLPKYHGKVKWQLNDRFKQTSFPFLPNINPHNADSDLIDAFYDAKTNIQKDDLYQLSHDSNVTELVYWHDHTIKQKNNLSSICPNDDCRLSGNWTFNQHALKYNLLVYNAQSIHINRLSPNKLSKIHNWDTTIQSKNRLGSNPIFVRSGGESFIMSVSFKNTKTRLKVYDITNGKLVAQKNLTNHLFNDRLFLKAFKNSVFEQTAKLNKRLKPAQYQQLKTFIAQLNNTPTCSDLTQKRIDQFNQLITASKTKVAIQVETIVRNFLSCPIQGNTWLTAIDQNQNGQSNHVLIKTPDHGLLQLNTSASNPEHWHIADSKQLTNDQLLQQYQNHLKRQFNHRTKHANYASLYRWLNQTFFQKQNNGRVTKPVKAVSSNRAYGMNLLVVRHHMASMYQYDINHLGNVSQKWRYASNENIKQIIPDLGLIWLLTDSGQLSLLKKNTGQSIQQFKLKSDTFFDLMQNYKKKQASIKTQNTSYPLPGNLNRPYMRQSFKRYD